MKKFDDNIRERVLADTAKGLSVREICRRHGIKARSTVFLWRRQSQPLPPETITSRELQQMKAELSRLRTENEILRRAGCSENSPKEIRQTAFLKLCRDYPLKRLCKVLGLTLGDGHYLRDHRVEHPLNEIRDNQLRLKIKEIFENSRNTYGKRRIRVALQRMSIIVSERKVSQLMDEMELVSRHVEYHWIRNAPRCSYFPNRLNREFDVPMPNTVWSADLTYIRVGYGWRYFFAIIDLCKRRVIGWGLSDCKTSEFISGVIKQTFRERGEPPGLLYHSDRGSENTKYLQREWCRSHDIVRSFSQIAAPHDNAVSEAFFATFKKEFVRKRVFENEESLYGEIDSYIHFYNEERIHTSIGMASPCESEAALLEPCVKILD